jgi:hypothetical protein
MFEICGRDREVDKLLAAEEGCRWIMKLRIAEKGSEIEGGDESSGPISVLNKPYNSQLPLNLTVPDHVFNPTSLLGQPLPLHACPLFHLLQDS